MYTNKISHFFLYICNPSVHLRNSKLDSRFACLLNSRITSFWNKFSFWDQDFICIVRQNKYNTLTVHSEIVLVYITHWQLSFADCCRPRLQDGDLKWTLRSVPSHELTISRHSYSSPPLYPTLVYPLSTLLYPCHKIQPKNPHSTRDQARCYLPRKTFQLAPKE